MLSNGNTAPDQPQDPQQTPPQQPQTGPLFSGPGARNNKPSFRVKLLTVAQYKSIESAKKYAIEEGIKVSSSNKVVHVQQQQMQSAFNAMQKQQAWSLMCRVYIGSINFTVTDEHLRTSFGVFGPLKNLNLSTDHVTGKHKGYAFLEFETPEAATLAVEQMNGLMLGGRNLKVGRPSNMPQAQTLIDQFFAESHVNNSIYVSCIHPALRDNDLISVFEAFGKVTSCDLPKDATCPTKHKGYAYLEYDTPQSALDAVAAMNMFDLGGQFIRVGKAITPPNSDFFSTTSSTDPTTTTTTTTPTVATTTTSSTSTTTSTTTTTSDATTTTPTTNNNNNISNGVNNSVMTSPSSSSPAPVTTSSSSSSPTTTTTNQTKDGDEDVKTTTTTTVAPPTPPPSTCTMLLENAVTIEDVDADLEEEMVEECSKYGKVLKVSIRPGQATDDVKIFVRFANQEDVQTAITSLHGRFFAGRKVEARFSDLDIQIDDDLHDDVIASGGVS